MPQISDITDAMINPMDVSEEPSLQVSTMSPEQVVHARVIHVKKAAIKSGSERSPHHEGSVAALSHICCCSFQCFSS